MLGCFPQASALLQRDDGHGILPDFRGEIPEIPRFGVWCDNFVRNNDAYNDTSLISPGMHCQGGLSRL